MVALILALAAIMPTAAAATSFSLSNFGVSDTPPTLSGGPLVAANSRTGDFLVVWSRGDFSFFGERIPATVVGRLVSRDGVPGSSTAIDTETTFNGGAATPLAAVFNSITSEYFVVYAAARPPALFARRLSANGTVVGNEVPIPVTASGARLDDDAANLAHNSISNEFLFVWRTVDGLFTQRLNATGTPVGTTTMITSRIAVARPGIVFNPSTSQYFVTWGTTVASQGDLTTQIVGQLIGPEGQLVGSPVPVSTPQFLQNQAAVAVNAAANQYLIAWADNRNPDTGSDIYARLLTGGGTQLGDDFIVSTLPLFERVPQVAFHPGANAYLVVWEASKLLVSNGMPTPRWILGQFVEASGTRRGEIFVVSESNTAVRPAVAASDPGRFMTAWRGTNVSVVAQALPASIAPQGPPLEGLVFDLHLQGLGRVPAASEVAAWVSFVRANPTAAAVAEMFHAFFESPEYAALPRTMLTRVRLLYHFVLGREPDPSEQAAWVGVLADRFSGVLTPLAIATDIHRARIRSLETISTDVAFRFYTAALGRPPSGAETFQELSRWADAIRIDTTGAARAFLRSPESLAIPRTVADQVDVLYRMFFARDPSSAERDAWVAVLLERFAPILADFASSPEFQRLVPDPKNPELVAPVVTRFYEHVLGRLPTASERDAWVQYLTATGDVAGLANAFFRSPEHLAIPRTFAERVRALYRAFLAREPSAAELPKGVDAFAMGVDDLVPSFAASPEFETVLFVNLAYRLLLGRAASDGEVAARVNELIAGGAVTTFVGMLLTSFEYSQRSASLTDHVERVNRLVDGPFFALDVDPSVAALQREQSRILDAFLASPEFAARLETLLRQ